MSNVASSSVDGRDVLPSRNGLRPRRADAHRHACRGRDAGFTLIEVMVAISLMAIVAILSWRGLESVSQAGERIDASAADTEEVLRSVGQLSRDVTQRAPASVLPAPPVPAGVVAPTTILPTSLAVNRRSDGTLALDLVRAVAGEPGHWQRVAWSVEDGVLRRRIGLAADMLPLPPADAVADPDRNPVADVMHDVQLLSLRAWVPQRGWLALPAADGPVAATGMEIAIVRTGRNGPETFRQVLVFE
jgi:general secretion pathway protein J